MRNGFGKRRIRQAKVNATLSANAEMILLYWDIGRMIAFYKEYSKGDTFLPQTVAKMESPGNQVRKKGQLVVAQLESLGRIFTNRFLN